MVCWTTSGVLGQKSKLSSRHRLTENFDDLFDLRDQLSLPFEHVAEVAEAPF